MTRVDARNQREWLMRIPDLNIKCPAGPSTRRCSRAMAHRRGLLRGKVTLGVGVTLVLGLLLAGSVYVSNQTTGLRTDIATLEYRREFLEAGTGQLLTRWNTETSARVIIKRAKVELGLEVQDNPGLVLMCGIDVGHEVANSGWRKFLSRFGGGDVAQAAGDRMGLVVGSMVSLTPRNAQAAGVPGGGGP